MPRLKLEASILDAISKGLLHQVRLLILLGHGLNVKNKKGQTSLMLCSLIKEERWGVKIAINLLETHRVLLDQTDFRGLTALHYACLFCRQKLAEVLLGYAGFNIQAMDLLLNRPIHYAVMSGNPCIVEMLLLYDKNLGINPSSWMTENAAGKTPMTLSKIYKRYKCYSILKDLVGDIKYPSKKDVHLTRLMTEPSYGEEWTEKESKDEGCWALGAVYKNPDIAFMDKYKPSFSHRAKLLNTSIAKGIGSIPFDVSHINNEMDDTKLPKYAMHFSLDLKYWDYLDEPIFNEVYLKAKPVVKIPEDIEEQELKEMPDDKTLKTQISKENKMKGKVKENKSKEDKIKENKSKEDKIKDDEGEEKNEEIIVTKDPKTVCKEYLFEEIDPIREEKQKLKVATDDDDEEREKDEEGEIGDGSILISKTVYTRPKLIPPLVLPLESKCIKDFGMANFRIPGQTISNVGRKPLSQNLRVASRHIVCVIMELILPHLEKGPPYTMKCKRLIKEVFDNGLFTRDTLNELIISGVNPIEYKMFRVYCEEYGKLKVRTIESLPINNRVPKAMFRKHFYEPKTKKLKPCCPPFPFFRVDHNEYPPIIPKPSNLTDRILMYLAANYRCPTTIVPKKVEKPPKTEAKQEEIVPVAIPVKKESQKKAKKK